MNSFPELRSPRSSEPPLASTLRPEPHLLQLEPGASCPMHWLHRKQLTTLSITTHQRRLLPPHPLPAPKTSLFWAKWTQLLHSFLLEQDLCVFILCIVFFWTFPLLDLGPWMGPGLGQAAQGSCLLCLAPSTPGRYPAPLRHLRIAGEASVYAALQPPDFSLPFCCPVGYSPVLLPTSHFALYLHLFLLKCILLLSNPCSGS